MNAPASKSPPTPSAADAALIGLDGRHARLRRRLLGGSAMVALALVAAVLWWARQDDNATVRYLTEPVTRADLQLKVVANGSLQATRTVSIGSELSGMIKTVRVDVNDRVHKGQVLMELDTAKLRDQLARSRAALAAAEAQVLQAQATEQEASAALSRLEAVRQLSGGQVPAETELDSARAAVARARAAAASARAGVAEARATVSTDTTNLSRAAIRSPIDGVVLTRNADAGNAVAASLQAVTLFTIAEDLERLKLPVNVDEADVSNLEIGQTASFTVSSQPARSYPAAITRVAYGSTTTDNVVTFATVLSVDNADRSLRPGMTATATIVSQEHRGVLSVPNTAWRYVPTRDATPGTAGGGDTNLLSRLMPRPPGGTASKQSRVQATGAGATRRLWVLRDGQPVAVSVIVGISDGRRSEVRAADAAQADWLAEGAAVIVDQTSGRATAAPAGGSAQPATARQPS